MEQYQVPMKKGIPAIAVLDSDGKLLYSQKGGEFEKARALAPEDVPGVSEQVEAGRAVSRAPDIPVLAQTEIP